MNRREFIGGAAASIVLGAECSVLGAEDALEKSKKWFKEAQFGMMAHWGLYTLLGGEWKGKPGKHAYGEWIMEGNRIPLKEYAALAKAFNPILFDPMDWMKRARDAGMKDILAIRQKCAAIGSNYMLNVGPDPLGRFPAAAIGILDGLKKGRVS